MFVIRLWRIKNEACFPVLPNMKSLRMSKWKHKKIFNCINNSDKFSSHENPEKIFYHESRITQMTETVLILYFTQIVVPKLKNLNCILENDSTRSVNFSKINNLHFSILFARETLQTVALAKYFQFVIKLQSQFFEPIKAFFLIAMPIGPRRVWV